jgi:hypothetical protein
MGTPPLRPAIGFVLGAALNVVGGAGFAARPATLFDGLHDRAIVPLHEDAAVVDYGIGFVFGDLVEDHIFRQGVADGDLFLDEVLLRGDGTILDIRDYLLGRTVERGPAIMPRAPPMAGSSNHGGRLPVDQCRLQSG